MLSGDIDLIVTYPHEDGKEKGIIRKLVRRLQAKGAKTRRSRFNYCIADFFTRL